MTKLEAALKVLKWQGGTVHQVNAAFNKFFKTNIDILQMSKSEFIAMIELYKQGIK